MSCHPAFSKEGRVHKVLYGRPAQGSPWACCPYVCQHTHLPVLTVLQEVVSTPPGMRSSAWSLHMSWMHGIGDFAKVV